MKDTARVEVGDGIVLHVQAEVVSSEDGVFVAFGKQNDIFSRKTGMSWKGNVEKLHDQFFEPEIDPAVQNAMNALSNLQVPEGYKLVVVDGQPVLKKRRSPGGGPKKAKTALTMEKGNTVERMADGKIFKIVSVSKKAKAPHLKTAKVKAGDGEEAEARNFGSRLFKDA
jgi:hypothetical protein